MSAESPALLKTSSTFYGPDGPWQAVTVSLGDPPQSIDLFPGGLTGSFILTSRNCSGYLTCAAGGVFDTSMSSTFHNTTLTIYYTGDQAYSLGTFLFTADTSVATDTLILERLDTNKAQFLMLRNFSLSIVPQFSIALSEEIKYPLQAGELSLGAGASFKFESSGDENLIPGALAKQGTLPSSTFGLHIGSACLDQALPLSLWLGGYDRQRVLGPISIQIPNQYSEFQIDLRDIGIAVEFGGSPFPCSSKDGLLKSGSTESNAPLSVFINTQAPFLSLPRSSCDAITQYLPVIFNVSLQLYLWDTKSPNYSKIVTSPSYLRFTFNTSASNNSNVTIKVPFRLLNLTLEPPLVTNPTFYFPCQTPNVDGRYSLGRAFLQAAFLGASWDDSRWYLAQAPGPNISSEPAAAAFSGSPESSSSQWADTWTGSWTPLPDSSQNTSTSPMYPQSKGVRSTHATIIGAIVGAVAVLCLVVIGTFALRRKRKKQKSGQLPFPDEVPVRIGDVRELELRGTGFYEMSHQDRRQELANEHLVELPHKDRAELSNNNADDLLELPERIQSRRIA